MRSYDTDYQDIYHRGKLTIAYNVHTGKLHFYNKDALIMELADSVYSNLYQVIAGIAGDYYISKQRNNYRRNNHKYFTVHKKKQRKKAKSK